MSDNYNGPELARQVIRLRSEVELLRAANIGLATESHNLQQEVERLRADAERYRWLRDRIYIDPTEFILRIADCFLVVTDGNTTQLQLDAAIDAARATAAPGDV